jgi:hypothetical protein
MAVVFRHGFHELPRISKSGAKDTTIPALPPQFPACRAFWLLNPEFWILALYVKEHSAFLKNAAGILTLKQENP